MVGNSSGRDAGSSTSCAKMIALAVARGLRDHHRCIVDGSPCRRDFSRLLAALIASSGSEASMSFFLFVLITEFLSGTFGELRVYGHLYGSSRSRSLSQTSFINYAVAEAQD